MCEAGHTSESQDVSNNLPPHSNACYMTSPRFWCGSDASEPPVPPTPHIRPKVNGVVYPFHGLRKGVAQRTFLLGCVRVGHLGFCVFSMPRSPRFRRNSPIFDQKSTVEKPPGEELAWRENIFPPTSLPSAVHQHTRRKDCKNARQTKKFVLLLPRVPPTDTLGEDTAKWAANPKTFPPLSLPRGDLGEEKKTTLFLFLRHLCRDGHSVKKRS